MLWMKRLGNKRDEKVKKERSSRPLWDRMLRIHSGSKDARWRIFHSAIHLPHSTVSFVFHVLRFAVFSAQKRRRPDLLGSDASGPSKYGEQEKVLPFRKFHFLFCRADIGGGEVGEGVLMGGIHGIQRSDGVMEGCETSGGHRFHRCRREKF